MSNGMKAEGETAIIEAAVTTLVIANRILAHEDIIDDFGHVSIRHPLDPERYFLSRSRSPALVTRSDILEFTLDGETVGDDPRAPYAERHIHGAIYRDRPDVNVVTHHHARSVLPFTFGGILLRPVFHFAAVIGSNIPIWDSREEFGDTNMIVDSMQMGHSLSRALDQGRVALLRGHGAVCAAYDLKAVVMISLGLRDNATVIQATQQVGEVVYLTDGEIEMTSSMFLEPLALSRAWEYFVARAGYEGL